MKFTERCTVRRSFEVSFWIAFVVFVCFMLSGGLATAQTHEAAVGGSVIGSDVVGFGFPFWGVTASGQVHVSDFDLGGGFTRANMPTIGTPGGYGKVAHAHVNYWFTDRFFAGVNYAHTFKAPSGFTQALDFVGVSGGIRLVGEQRHEQWKDAGHGVRYRIAKPGRHEDRITFSYDKEVNTDDGFNLHRVNAWTTRWSHDFPLGGTQAIRIGAAYSFSRFDLNVLRTHVDYLGITQYKELDRVSGNGFTLSISYVFKGS